MTRWRLLLTSYVPHWAWYPKKNFQKIYLIIFYNFKLAVRSFKGWKRQLGSQITEKGLNDVSEWRHLVTLGMECKTFFSNIPLILFSIFNKDQLEMFVRMLTVHCDQNNSYEITINGFQVKKINEIRNVIFGLHYGKPSLALRPKFEYSSGRALDEIRQDHLLNLRCLDCFIFRQGMAICFLEDIYASW